MNYEEELLRAWDFRLKTLETLMDSFDISKIRGSHEEK